MRRHHWFRCIGPRPVSLVITSDQTSYNFYTAAGSPGAVIAYIEIASGVRVRLFSFGAWPAGSVVTLVNRGYCYGPGGNGGNGQNWSNDATGIDGTNGGDAITLPTAVGVAIDNTYGYILGGGGGGAGGWAFNLGPLGQWGGGAGGGGQGGSIGGTHGLGPSGKNGYDGTAGSFDGYGSFGWDYSYAARGGFGGGWGENGENPGSGGLNIPGGSPGLAGKAVNLNGRTVTWLGGYNPTQVRGAVA